LLILRNLADSDDNENNEKKQQQQKQPPSSPSIRTLEKIAIREARNTLSPQDILERIPKGLETPTYTVLSSHSKNPFFEIRQYDPFSTCTLTMDMTLSSSTPSVSSPNKVSSSPSGSAFNQLAGYLFGKNQSSEKMKMTSPVFTSSNDISKQMSFVLPSEYWNQIERAPQPMESSSSSSSSSSSTNKGVQLIQQEEQVRAVLLFGGFASKKDVSRKKKELLDTLQNTQWEMKGNDQITIAQYNDPFTPPWKRRNEVSVLVQPRS